MVLITRLLERNFINSSSVIGRFQCTKQASGVEGNDEEFRVLNLRTTSQNVQSRKRFVRKTDVQLPRTHKMATDQDWTAVWSGPRSFHPASVPLQLRQGYTVKGAAPPAKYANAELMKIPNFLHLTPPTIKKQCEALKKFCTPWPNALQTEEKWHPRFPVEVNSTDYCLGLPTIRNPGARSVTLSVKLSDLQFDAHAKDKFLRLVGKRYNRDTDILTIVADCCPLRTQNYDYAMYLLTACYHESFITEPWEKNKSEIDMEYYYFNRNKSKTSVETILNWGKSTECSKTEAGKAFAQSLEQLINDGENVYSLDKYKNEVKLLLGIKGL